MSSVDWDFKSLEELVEDRGDNVTHELGISCPTCRAEDAYGSTLISEGKPLQGLGGSISCPSCYGIGWVYRNPRCIRGLVVGVNTGPNRSLVDAGWAVPGDAVFSPSLTLDPLGDFDRITIHHPVPVGSGQTIVRNAANMGVNHMLSTGLTPEQDRLWYIPACITYCMDQEGTTYEQGTDFSVDGKLITWVGNKPADGMIYTVKYLAYLEWIVFTSPFTRFDNARSLGQKVLLRKAHTAFINAHPVDSPIKRADEAMNFSVRTTI